MTYRELEESTDTLEREYRGIVRVTEIGRTRCGERIRAIAIGEGPLKALLFGAPHPNEPIGTLTLDYLSWRLAADRDLRALYRYTWIIVKAVDIDGLKMNEGWFKKNLSIGNYAENFYRPAGNVQVEWSFPISYKKYRFDNPTPETRALMKIIDEYRPDFIYSLHNSGFGGAYYYISGEAPLLYPIFQLYPRTLGIPLGLGEPEVPWAQRLSTAIYRMVSTRDYYDFLEAQGIDPLSVIRHGGSSYDYASERNRDVFELVTEVPYFYDPRIEDLDQGEITRREAIIQSISFSENTYRSIAGFWKKARELIEAADPCSETGKLAEAIDYFITNAPKNLEAKRAWAMRDKSLERKATRAEIFDSSYISKFYLLLQIGMLRRLAELEHRRSGKNAWREVVEGIEPIFDELLNYLERNGKYRVLEIRDAVKTQLASGLYAALYRQILAK